MRRVRAQLVFSKLGARRRVPPRSDAPPSLFTGLLRQHEDERHQRIVDGLPQARGLESRNPPGWRAEDILGQGDGFLVLAEAAKTLGLGEAETIAMCARGLLEAEERGGFLYVRPAIVTTLGVSA